NIITHPKKETEVTLKIYAGWTLNEIDEKLSNQGFFEKNSFIEETKHIKEKNKLSFSEGWFQSGVYTVNRDEIVTQLAEKMFEGTQRTLSEYSNEIQKQNLKTEDVIVIASLIEAETHDKDQMKMISGIIRNRLNQEMPLGIDATTRYEKKDWINPLQTSDFVSDSSYNTRRNKGLPITGICCSSEEALKATIFYTENPYFYYRHDANGNIHYSITYSQHLESLQENP
ncbi:MAG: endolytic transglycosylase MltG, partial [Sphaerochaetaceae bacterium]|nr:endolytic transglycosylase MltG [Sphaerochaetaceae bacterium]